jgi:glycosyltransferase involved in cell wall biosynthesis
MTISFIIPTKGRESIKETIASIETWPGDEILKIQHIPPSGNWGNDERQEGTERAKCDYIAYIDDDNVYVKGHRALMDKAIEEKPGFPCLFRIKFPSGRIIWRKRWVGNGNVDAQMILVPNDKKMLYHWDQEHSWADYQFINRWLWHAKDCNWKKEVIALMGHNDEKFEQHLSFRQAKKKGILL